VSLFRLCPPFLAHHAAIKMGTILENGEMQLTEEECEKLKMPPNSVVVGLPTCEI